MDCSSSRTFRFMIVASLLLVSFAAPVLAGPEPETHDGFFLRLGLLGAGGGSTSGDDGIDELEISGAGAMLDLAVGAMVADNLALHATLFGWVLQDPNGQFNNGPEGEIPGDLTMAAIGIGVTRYFMPSNFYVSGSIGAGSLELDLSGGLGSGSSDTGLALQGVVGKEWWVGYNWGLGVAGMFGYHNIPDGGVDVDWKGAHFGLLFSVTFN